MIILNIILIILGLVLLYMLLALFSILLSAIGLNIHKPWYQILETNGGKVYVKYWRNCFFQYLGKYQILWSSWFSDDEYYNSYEEAKESIKKHIQEIHNSKIKKVYKYKEDTPTTDLLAEYGKAVLSNNIKEQDRLYKELDKLKYFE